MVACVQNLLPLGDWVCTQAKIMAPMLILKGIHCKGWELEDVLQGPRPGISLHNIVCWSSNVIDIAHT